MNNTVRMLERWIWPAIILTSAAVAGFMVSMDATTPLRHVFVIWFIVVCPGMAYVRFLRLKNPIIEWTLAVALSFALTSLTAIVLLYAGWWRPEQGFMAVLVLTVVGVALSVLRKERADKKDPSLEGVYENGSRGERAA